MGIVFCLIVFLLGLVVGSFLNCVIYRLALPRGRSFCPYCKHPLSWQDLIPVLSFFILRGKCRYCGKKISWQYPLVEIATALLFLLIFNSQLTENSSLLAYRELFSVLSFQDLLTICFLLLISCFLLIIFVYDLRHFVIPDKIIYPAIGIALIYNFYQLLTTHYPLSTVLNNLYAAFGAAVFFLAIVLVSRGKWMGLGDVKLAFLMGLFLGFPNILIALFFAFLIGAIIGVGLILAKRKTLKSEVPFGPFLVTGTFIALFWGERIAQWYLDLFLYV